MKYRVATLADCAILGKLNHQLIQDEGHRNPMTVPELERRMKDWLSKDYTAFLFERDRDVLAYALYREQPDEIYLRHLFVTREHRRMGIGREAIQILRARVWPSNKRLTVSVLTSNEPAMAFWRAVGYTDYCLTLEILPPPKHT